MYVLLYLLAFVGGTGSRYGRRYSIQSIRTLDHLGDRALEHVELNFGVSVSNSRRATSRRTDAFRGCESSLLQTEFSELHRARYCCEGILLFEAAMKRM